MIYGIVAEDAEMGNVIAPSLASLDFINGVYAVGNVSLTASQVVTDTGRISADGLSIQTNNDGTHAAHVPSGALLTAALTRSYTCIIDVNLLAGAIVMGVNSQLFLVANSGEASYLTFGVQGDDTGAWSYLKEGDGDAISVNISTNDSGVPGLNRYGYTRQINHRATTFGDLSVIYEDSSDETTISSWVYPATKCDLAAAFDGVTSGTTVGYIRKITLVSPVTDLELATLTA